MFPESEGFGEHGCDAHEENDDTHNRPECRLCRSPSGRVRAVDGGDSSGYGCREYIRTETNSHDVTNRASDCHGLYITSFNFILVFKYLYFAVCSEHSQISERFMSDKQCKTEIYINTLVKLLFAPFGTEEKRKMEKESFVSSFEVYHQCRYRDICLRYMGENPIQWADVSVTPCPCTPAFFREVMAYAKVIRDEDVYGKLPYTRMRLVHWMTENHYSRKKARKVREIPLTQMRLSECQTDR